ncbi:sulfite dehydrogenase [Roseicella aquatilis]|uniref:Sulfite dehydrogenase n=1 Tax=Roseicella aquatilis TaxID=2527868 RepID=A0A4R4D3X0_9PROT|nr:sulfite dehydrogenase [Roseicella aquatilis]TCZ52757.1 sulfite dehydrogenase [Roseicella aquatilis]
MAADRRDVRPEFHPQGFAPVSPQRRGLLRAGLGLGAGSALLAGRGLRAEEVASPPAEAPYSLSLGPGVVDRVYGQPSRFEAGVIRRNVPWLTASPETSISFTPLQHQQGIITPSGVFFERYHAGRPTVDPSEHRLMIHGLVDRPLLLTMEDLRRFPSVSRIHFIECPANGGMEWRGAQLNSLQFTHGMIGCAEWTGVKLSTLLEETGLTRGAKWVLAEGADGAHMNRSIPLEKCLDDCLVVYGQNGEALRPEQGYPVRLLIPGWQGNVNVKWLRRLEIGNQPWFTREETSKYTELMPDGRARGFTWPLYAKSVITFPCPEMPAKGPGIYEIRGFAWSGLGKVAQVDVSLDGGVNWQRARLQEPVLPKALTRFTLEWRWDGRPALLQSRAVDETGFVQPTLAALRRVRGTNPIYNKNAIQTWQVKADGTVFNVQLA